MNTQTLERPTTVAELALAPKSNIVPMPPQPVARAYPPKIAKALMSITRQFGAIAKASNKDDTKGGWNTFHNYGYQRWEDILERESVLLCEHGIIIQQSEVSRNILDKLVAITYEFTIINEDGDVWPDRPVYTAIARLIDTKGVFDDKAANKCHTQAHKYFLLHLFKVKTRDVAADDSDSDAEEPKQTAPKPPRPGSAEAAALDGPRLITEGTDAATWAEAFIRAINGATPEQLAKWIELNKLRLDKIATAYPDVNARVQAAINPPAPKPPRPDMAPAAPTIPDPTTDPPGWIKWLGEKMAGFETYEAGEQFWNDRIDPLDLPRDTQEDAMSVWQKFSERFEP